MQAKLPRAARGMLSRSSLCCSSTRRSSSPFESLSRSGGRDRHALHRSDEPERWLREDHHRGESRRLPRRGRPRGARDRHGPAGARHARSRGRSGGPRREPLRGARGARRRRRTPRRGDRERGREPRRRPLRRDPLGARAEAQRGGRARPHRAPRGRRREAREAVRLHPDRLPAQRRHPDLQRAARRAGSHHPARDELLLDARRGEAARDDRSARGPHRPLAEDPHPADALRRPHALREARARRDPRDVQGPRASTR